METPLHHDADERGGPMTERRIRRLDTTERWATTPPPETTILLQNLVQAYAMFTDAGETARLAELFTADAEWDGTSLGYGTASGPEAIAELVCGRHRPDEPMMHMPGPVLLVALDDDEVHGVSWCTATRWTKGAMRPVIYFYYEDVFHRADEKWRFSRRHLHAAFPG
jgi:hypothetical protein